ncbi:MAG: Rrf2 family transcriptional regulator [Armatimonadota bacterium]
MSNLIKISDAASYALHAMARLAQSQDEIVRIHQIAEELEISENHLAKVCQRLVKAGLVNAQRGPKGGLSLTKEAFDITLLEIFEAIEGTLSLTGCLLKKKMCDSDTCVLGNLVKDVNDIAYKFLSETTLDKIANSEKSYHNK